MAGQRPSGRYGGPPDPGTGGGAPGVGRWIRDRGGAGTCRFTFRHHGSSVAFASCSKDLFGGTLGRFFGGSAPLRGRRGTSTVLSSGSTFRSA